jgi:hypothetical protein
METTTEQSFLELCYTRRLKLSCESFTWRNMKNGHAFALVSATHKDMTENQMDKEQEQLVYEANKMFQCRCHELLGGVIETNFKGEINSHEGTTIFMWDISLSNAIKAGINMRQDFILYCNGIDFMGLIDTSEKSGMSGDVLIEFAYRQSDNDIQVIQKAVKEYFERLIKWSNPEYLSVLEPKSCSFKLFEGNKRFEMDGMERWLAYGRKIM